VSLIHLGAIDDAILLTHFVFVPGISVVVKRFVKSNGDFYLSGRIIPVWIARARARCTGIAYRGPS